MQRMPGLKNSITKKLLRTNYSFLAINLYSLHVALETRNIGARERNGIFQWYFVGISWRVGFSLRYLNSDWIRHYF